MHRAVADEKWVVNFVKSLYEGDKMEKYDLIVIGQGAAAFAATIKASELGAKVAMVGYNATPGTLIGGTCVNVGCMPSKKLLYNGEVYDYENHGIGGINFSGKSLEFEKIIATKDEMVKKFRKEKYANVINNLPGVTYYNEEATFISSNQIKAGRRILNAYKFVIATGAQASIPTVDGLNKIDYLTNEEALELKKVPKSMVVVGGRALGLEFAQMYSHFGTKVIVLQRSEKILPENEPEISDALKQYLEGEGTNIITGMSLNYVNRKGKSKILNISTVGKTFDIECEQLLFATGRKPNTEGINLDKAGVKTDDRGFIITDDEAKTSNPNIYAGGDCCGEPMLETIAAKEGAIATENALKGRHRKIDYDSVSSAVFTYPQVANVGLTDKQAVEGGYKCTCRTLYFDAIPKSHIINDLRGLIKMVVEKDTKRILGVHVLSPYAADIIHVGVLAVKNKMTIDDIIDTVFNFPTLSEAVKLVAQSFYKDVNKLSCCIE